MYRKHSATVVVEMIAINKCFEEIQCFLNQCFRVDKKRRKNLNERHKALLDSRFKTPFPRINWERELKILASYSHSQNTSYKTVE